MEISAISGRLLPRVSYKKIGREATDVAEQLEQEVYQLLEEAALLLKGKDNMEMRCGTKNEKEPSHRRGLKAGARIITLAFHIAHFTTSSSSSPTGGRFFTQVVPGAAVAGLLPRTQTSKVSDLSIRQREWAVPPRAGRSKRLRNHQIAQVSQ